MNSITIIPRLDMVVAHKTAVPPPRNVTNEAYFGTILPEAFALTDRRARTERHLFGTDRGVSGV